MPIEDQISLAPSPECFQDLLASEKEFQSRNARRRTVKLREIAQTSCLATAEEEPISLEEFYFPELLPVSMPIFSSSNISLKDGRSLSDLDLFEGPR